MGVHRTGVRRRIEWWQVTTVFSWVRLFHVFGRVIVYSQTGCTDFKSSKNSLNFLYFFGFFRFFHIFSDFSDFFGFFGFFRIFQIFSDFFGFFLDFSDFFRFFRIFSDFSDYFFWVNNPSSLLRRHRVNRVFKSELRRPLESSILSAKYCEIR